MDLERTKALTEGMLTDGRLYISGERPNEDGIFQAVYRSACEVVFQHVISMAVRLT